MPKALISTHSSLCTLRVWYFFFDRCTCRPTKRHNSKSNDESSGRVMVAGLRNRLEIHRTANSDSRIQGLASFLTSETMLSHLVLEREINREREEEQRKRK